jgi:hypothetical protein
MTRPVSLGLLPSGPDPVGEGCVHRQPPAGYIGDLEGENKCRATRNRLASRGAARYKGRMISVPGFQQGWGGAGIAAPR